MRKRWVLLLSVVLAAYFASFYAYEGRANTEIEETLPEEVNRPEWKIGDWWEYEVTYYILRSEKEKEITGSRKVKLEVSEKEGKVRITPYTIRYYYWPMKVGRKWTVKDSRGISIVEIVGVEKMEVPAGEFLTLKIVRKKTDGTIVEESWYSPKVKWFVKKKQYLESGKIGIWELIEFKVENDK